VVFWRSSAGQLVAGPGACPQLGAVLDNCPVIDGTLWHGIALAQNADQTWSPYQAYDDGVLLSVGLPTDGEEATDRPALPVRPPLRESVSAVISKHLRTRGCNRQSARPWHGSCSTRMPSVTSSLTTMPAMITC
jgi:hypothetical protein